MSRVWFAQPLETVALWWRISRRDGVALGFTTHDRDLWFAGLVHRAAPGMVPSAIRRSAGFEADSAEVEGALSHDSIAGADLAAGRYDGAVVQVGMVDWQTLETQPLYQGTIGAISEESGRFSAQLQSRKADLARDGIPRTSPACRAAFCGPECGLSAARFTREAVLGSADAAANSVTLSGLSGLASYEGGTLRWFDGPHAGDAMGILAVVAGTGLVLDRPLAADLQPGLRVAVREGCDHRLTTCAARFGNVINFRGEPHLPGNDLIARYPPPQQ